MTAARASGSLNPTPNTVWAADITYIPTREGWLYRAVILDLSARRYNRQRRHSALGDRSPAEYEETVLKAS